LRCPRPKDEIHRPLDEALAVKLISLIGKQGVLVTGKLAGVTRKIAERLNTQCNSLTIRTKGVCNVKIV